MTTRRELIAEQRLRPREAERVLGRLFADPIEYVGTGPSTATIEAPWELR